MDLEYTQARQEIINIFSDQPFLRIPKKLIILLGGNESIYLANLLENFLFFSKNYEMEDDWFYLEQDRQAHQTGFTDYQIRAYRKKLTDTGLLQLEKRGLPPKYFYKLNMEVISWILKTSFYYDKEAQIIGPEDTLKNLTYYLKKLNLLPKKILGSWVKKFNLLPYIIKNNTKTINNKTPHFFSETQNSHGQDIGEIDNPEENNEGNPLPDPDKKPKKKSIPSECINFARRFYHNLSRNGGKKKYTPKQIMDGANVVRQLIQLDRYDLEDEIEPALKWAIEDDFWSAQVRSLSALRTKSGRNQELKFTNIFNSYSASRKRTRPCGNRAGHIPGRSTRPPDMVLEL